MYPHDRAYRDKHVATHSIPIPLSAFKLRISSQKWPHHKAHLTKYNNKNASNSRLQLKQTTHASRILSWQISGPVLFTQRAACTLQSHYLTSLWNEQQRRTTAVQPVREKKYKMAWNAGETAVAVILFYTEMLRQLLLFVWICRKKNVT